MKVVIADDEPLARSLLRTLLYDADIEVVGDAENGPQAVALVNRLRPDAIFLDIDMPGGGGIFAAHQLQNGSTAEVVFVTAHENHAVDAFELGAVDYVLKPVRRPRLAKALDRVRARLAERETGDSANSPEKPAECAFWVRALHGRVRLPVSDIVWIEAARDHVYFHTIAASYLHRITMAQLEREIGDSGLARIQRSAFVRLSEVTGILRRGKSVVLLIGSAARVTVGPSYEARILASLAAVGAKQPR